MIPNYTFIETTYFNDEVISAQHLSLFLLMSFSDLLGKAALFMYH